MNVKSMLVGFLIAVVASTGTYFLVPPPRDADAAFGGLSVKELYRALDTCVVTSQGTINCARHRFAYPFLGGERQLAERSYCSHKELKDDLEWFGRTMSQEKCMKHYEPYRR